MKCKCPWWLHLVGWVFWIVPLALAWFIVAMLDAVRNEWRTRREGIR